MPKLGLHDITSTNWTYLGERESHDKVVEMKWFSGPPEPGYPVECCASRSNKEEPAPVAPDCGTMDHQTPEGHWVQVSPADNNAPAHVWGRFVSDAANPPTRPPKTITVRLRY